MRSILGAMQNKLTYMHLVDKLIGHDTIKAPRQRNMLNMLAFLPRVQPNGRSYAIIDIGQSIDRATLKTDGICPTMARNSTMWSLRDGRFLKNSEIAKLMGHTHADASVSPSKLKQMLGNSVHVATGEMGLVALIVATLQGT